jgi:hypothetical protein
MGFIAMADNNDNVKIKKSKIKGAKKGLYSTKGFKKGEFICWYTGVFVAENNVDNGYYESDYLYNPGNGSLIIDAEDKLCCYGRYANDSLSLRQNNADFDKYDDVDAAHLIATKTIRKGSEIYVPYGPDFWAEKHLIGLSEEDLTYIKDDLVNDWKAQNT